MRKYYDKYLKKDVVIVFKKPDEMFTLKEFEDEIEDEPKIFEPKNVAKFVFQKLREEAKNV